MIFFCRLDNVRLVDQRTHTQRNTCNTIVVLNNNAQKYTVMYIKSAQVPFVIVIVYTYE